MRAAFTLALLAFVALVVLVVAHVGARALHTARSGGEPYVRPAAAH